MNHGNAEITKTALAGKMRRLVAGMAMIAAAGFALAAQPALAFDNAEGCLAAVKETERDLIESNVTTTELNEVAAELEAIQALCNSDLRTAEKQLSETIEKLRIMHQD